VFLSVRELGIHSRDQHFWAARWNSRILYSFLIIFLCDLAPVHEDWSKKRQKRTKKHGTGE
jgi:hypothetical protein